MAGRLTSVRPSRISVEFQPYPAMGQSLRDSCS